MKRKAVRDYRTPYGISPLCTSGTLHGGISSSAMGIVSTGVPGTSLTKSRWKRSGAGTAITAVIRSKAWTKPFSPPLCLAC